jgi:hypothetical protein
MTEFVASNGNKIRHSETGLFVEGSSINDGDRLFPSQVVALREFFQHERDIELGRWRSKERPTYVAYRTENGVTVVDEFDGDAAWVSHEGTGQSLFDEVAREFFAAHPEPKPWESAKPGEVWWLRVEGTDREYATIMGRAKFPHPVDHLYFMPTNDANAPKLGVKATVISGGRRIWPEVSE